MWYSTLTRVKRNNDSAIYFVFDISNTIHNFLLIIINSVPAQV